MNRLLLTLFFLILFFSCSQGDVLDIEIVPEDTIDYKEENNDTIKILAVGNSASEDAYSYVPYLFPKIARRPIVVGILYYPYGSLKDHWNFVVNNKNVCTYHSCRSDKEPWNSKKKVSLEYVLKAENWDIVTFQQIAKDALIESSYHPALDDLIEFTKSLCKNNVIFGWFLTPAYPEGYSYLQETGIDSDELYHNVIQGNLKNTESNKFSFIIPVATATQNARHTVLSNIGDYGQLSFDGLHLQEGLPCQIEAYTICQYIINWFNIDATITSDFTLVTDKWLKKKNIPGPHGNSVGASEKNLEIAKESVLSAISNPFELSYY